MKCFFSIGTLSILLIFSMFLCPSTASAQSSAMQEWSQLINKPELAKFFTGLFTKIGVKVRETGENFTVTNQGSSFEFKDGIDESVVDYVVDIDLKDVASVREFGKDEAIDDIEAFRIVLVLFSPLTQASLNNPKVRRGFQLSLGGIDKHMHVYLLGPKDRHASSHTLLFHKKHWYVIPGIHGETKREFRLDVNQALEFQKKMFEAQQGNTNKDWRKFRKWYVSWRDGVSKRV